MRVRRDGTFAPVGDAVRRYLRSHGLTRPSRESLVPVVWGEVVGEWYRSHTEVLRVDRGIVTVRCDTASSAQQLQLDSAVIIRRLNERLGGRTIRELRPSSAGIARLGRPSVLSAELTAVGPTAGELNQIALDDVERDWVDAVADSIEDQSLRTRLTRILAHHCRLTRWRLAHGYHPCPDCGVLVEPRRRRCMACDPGRVPAQGSTDVLEPLWSRAARRR